MKKTIITVIGRDTVGILAKVCTYLAKNKVNILDISQTVTGGYFNMMMIVDLSECTKSFDAFSMGLERIGASLVLKTNCQKAEIFEKMHRV